MDAERVEVAGGTRTWCGREKFRPGANASPTTNNPVVVKDENGQGGKVIHVMRVRTLWKSGNGVKGGRNVFFPGSWSVYLLLGGVFVTDEMVDVCVCVCVCSGV